MQKFILLLAAVIFGYGLQAQNGKITGNIQNPEKTGIKGATVQLVKQPGNKVAKMNLTDKSGNFSFENIPAGKYKLLYTAVGYENKTTDVIELTAEKSSIEMPSVELAVMSKSLGTVTVTSTKPLIEQKIDRMVVNVDASPSNAGATALEVLEKSPGVTVDNDGNISLKGKAGVIVMMDGKPTYLSAADLANVLRNLPASALDRIEILTNPSAKYDATGNSGVIDIKTKKGRVKGSNGSISVGTTESLFRQNGKEEILHKPTISVNYNYKKDKFNFFTNAVYNYREGRNQMDVVSRYYRDGKRIDSTSTFVSTFRGRNNNYTLKTGLDFTPNKKNSYGIVLSGFLFAGRPQNSTYTTYTTLANVPFSKLNSTTSSELSFNNGAVNLNYRHTYDSTGKELTLDLDYAKYNNTTDQLLSTGFFNGNDVRTADSMYLRGHLPSEITIYSVKSDFVKPFKNGRIEFGIKSSYVESDNLVQYERKAGTKWVPDARNNHFIYKENINAAYVNANRKLGKWDAQFGLRAENTNTEGVQEIDNSKVKRNYVSLFPSAFLSHPLDKSNTLTISASRRLQRPNYQDLNPFTFFLDSLSYRQGNPYLTPQFSYNYELSNNYKGKLITTINYTDTKDVISQIINRKRGPNGELIGFLTSDNIANYTNLGLAITAPVKIKKWWSANFFTNVYRNHYKGTYISNETGKAEVVPLDIAFTSFTVNISNNFNLGKKGWTGEVSGWYRYKTAEQLSIAYPMGQLNFGLAKNNLMKGRAALRFNARDPFNFQYNRRLTKYGSVDISQRNRWDNRQYGVNFTYRFGKQQQQKKKVSATEEEQARVGSAG